MIALLLMWTLALGAVVGLSGLHVFPVGTALLSVGSAAAGLSTRSGRALCLGAWAWTGTAVLAASFASGGVSHLAWPLLLGSLWILIAAACVRNVADTVAGWLGIGFACAIFAWAASFADVQTAMGLVFAMAFLYLGLSRAMVKSDMLTAGSHYSAAWTAAAASAGTLLYLGAPLNLTPELGAVVCILGLTAIAVWALQGLYPAFQALVCAALASLFLVPGLEDRITEGSQLAFPGQPLAVLLGLALLFAAGAAMTVRGLRSREGLRVALGGAASVSALAVAGRPDMLVQENVVIMAIAAIAATTALLAARVR